MMAVTPLHVLFRVTVDGGALSHYDVQSSTVLCRSCILCIGGRSDGGEIMTGIIPTCCTTTMLSSCNVWQVSLSSVLFCFFFCLLYEELPSSLGEWSSSWRAW